MKAYFCTALLLLFGAFAIGQQPQNAQDTYKWWFERQCAMESELGLKAMATFANELNPMLIAAFEKGAAQTWVEEKTSSEMKQFRETIELAKKQGAKESGLSDALFADFINTDVKTYEGSYRAALIDSYKRTALDGLAATHSLAGKSYLEKVARDPSNAYAQTAQVLLSRMPK